MAHAPWHVTDVFSMFDDHFGTRPNGVVSEISQPFQLAPRDREARDMHAIQDCVASVDNLSACTCSGVYEFIRKHNLEGGDECTHTCDTAIYGGKYYIPGGPVEEHFNKLYTKSLDEGRRMYFSRKRTPVYKFYMCITGKVHNTDRLHADCFDQITAIQHVIRRFFPDVVETEIKVLLTAVMHITHATTFKEEEGVDISIRLHFPNLFVSNHESQILQSSVISALGEPMSSETRIQWKWSSVVNVVYDRMPGSSSLSTCTVCKSLGKAAKRKCITCHGSGRIPTCIANNNAYMVVSGHGTADEETSDRAEKEFAYALTLTDVRTSAGTRADSRFEQPLLSYFEDCNEELKCIADKKRKQLAVMKRLQREEFDMLKRKRTRLNNEMEKNKRHDTQLLSEEAANDQWCKTIETFTVEFV